ncbi:MAG TPA: glutamate formimidoyltransferase [Candidatus Bathyarchaeota archaeon]|nr:MAG: glutamate formimidoyltransferase [Candidatus Bathyarchaeota archaeon]HDJ25708.1 glutamate formimidoyltransferase [Candidatus Bathyarchaeota archaeon]
MGLVCCTPNFSTSDPAVVGAILRAIRSVEGAYVLDHTYDQHYNRLVVVFAGEARAVLEAMLAAAKVAVEEIDMRYHSGQHPRIGAVDVVPFVPLAGTSMEECVELAREFGRRFAEECGVPVYLYAEAATSPERRSLDWIRKGEFERLAETMAEPGREPDFGPRRPHPTAGATAVGARKPIINFNVILGTSSLKVAKKVARALHSEKGGLSGVKAIGVFMPREGQVQVGMVISDPDKTPLYRVMELVRLEARRFGVPVVGAEFCGPVPLRAVLEVARYYLQAEGLSEDSVMEVALAKALGRWPS